MFKNILFRTTLDGLLYTCTWVLLISTSVEFYVKYIFLRFTGHSTIEAKVPAHVRLFNINFFSHSRQKKIVLTVMHLSETIFQFLSMLSFAVHLNLMDSIF